MIVVVVVARVREIIESRARLTARSSLLHVFTVFVVYLLRLLLLLLLGLGLGFLKQLMLLMTRRR